MTEPAFFGVQRRFTRYLRDPENRTPPSDVKPDGLAVYTNAVIANMEAFMGDNFPRVKEVLHPDHWRRMVRDYYIRHESKASLFVELPDEFLSYLDVTRDDPDDPPFLSELAHFENLENIVSTDEAVIDEGAVDREGDSLHRVPVINPTTRIARYAYPVHVIDADNQPLEPPAAATNIVAFRDRGNVYGFMDVNSATARIVDLLMTDQGLTGEQILRTIAAELKHPDVDAVISGGTSILSRLVERDVIIGTRI